MLPQVEPWLPAERLRREYDAIGFFLSGHPLDDYATVLKRLRVQSWAEFSRAVKTGATAGKVAATVVSRMERRTKTGNKMGIIGLSDPTGHFEAVLFSEGLAQYRDVLEPGAAVLLQLGAELQGEDVRARVLHAEPLDDAAAKTQKGLRIFVRDTKPLDSIARRLQMPKQRRSGSPAAQAKPAASGGGRRRRVAGVDARPRNRGGDEASRPLQGLAADRGRDQGGIRRGGRADAVGRQVTFAWNLAPIHPPDWPDQTPGKATASKIADRPLTRLYTFGAKVPSSNVAHSARRKRPRISGGRIETDLFALFDR